MIFKLASTLCLAFAVAQGAPSAPSFYGAPPLSPPPPSYGAPPPPPPPSYGAPTAPQPIYAPAPAAPQPIPPYAYNYAVLDAVSGNDFSAEEQAQGGAVSGQYKVLRADGVIMTVTYSVEGESGFVADIVTEPAPAFNGSPAAAGSDYGAPPPSPLAQYLPSYAK